MGRLYLDLNSKTLEHTGIRDNLHSTTQLPYIIFCSGMSRSASSWSYKTCKTLVRLRTPENKIDCGYLNEADTFADAYVSTKMKSGYDALIYFSHVINKRALRMILCGIAKNVYTYRDPRDSIASIMRNKGCKYGPAFDFVHSSLLLFNLFAADQYSLQTTNKPEHLISALKKLTVENLGNLTPHWLNVMLNHSHPPVLDRIKALKNK